MCIVEAQSGNRVVENQGLASLNMSVFRSLRQSLSNDECPFMPHSQSSTVLEEVSVMKPLYTLILCLPAALVFIACGCGVAVLLPPTARPAEHPTVDRRRGRRRAA